MPHFLEFQLLDLSHPILLLTNCFYNTFCHTFTAIFIDWKKKGILKRFHSNILNKILTKRQKNIQIFLRA